jgi:hypothetical protein
MSVEDVSERTRIRRTIISDIERDDYTSCGGDFYARGHIRAIAKVVGADPVPLIEQYDDDVAARERAAEAVTGPAPSDWLEADSGARSLLAQVHPVAGDGKAGSRNGDSDGQVGSRRRPHGRRSDTAPQPRLHPGPRPARRAAAEPETAAQPVVPETAAQPVVPETAPRPDLPGGVRAELTGAAGPQAGAAGVIAARLRTGGLRAAAVASPAIRDAVTGARRIGGQSAQQAAVGLERAGVELRRAGVELRRAGVGLRQAAAGGLERFTRVRTAEELPSRLIGTLAIFLAALIAVLYAVFSGPARSAPRPAVSPAHGARHPAHGAGRTRPGASRSASSGPAAPVALQPVRAAAFGPGGMASGDNPGQADLAISGRHSAGWNTNWYTTAEFGGLQSGTGLLLDLGRPETVTGVTISLGPAAGALIQLRAGNAAVPAGLRTIAQARSSGGTLTLSLPTPAVQARYLLIWFTRLPPDTSGTYQATIYHVGVTGRPAGA